MNKEQYLAIVASWKNFINEGKHKKYKEYYDYTNFGLKSMENGKVVPWTTFKDYGYRWLTDLHGIHHLIYMLIRKRDLYRSFSKESIHSIIDTFKWSSVHGYRKEEYIAKILAPFGDNLTLEMVKDLISNFKIQDTSRDSLL